MRAFDLSQYNISVCNIFRNASPAKLYEEAIRHEPGTSISSTGALIAYSGAKTGRSPKDKRVVQSPSSANEIWWGPVTRAIIDAIYSGALTSAATKQDSTFGFDVVAQCPNVPKEILIPEETWKDSSAYRTTAQKLAGLFVKNFAQYENGVSEAVRAAGPKT